MSNYAAFGEFFKKTRIAKGYSLRQFCQKYDLDPGNISKLERGLLSPPSARDILERYASCLEIEKNTDDWYTFFDLAAACSGKIPEDVMNDKDLVKKLPIIFRTLRGKQLPAEELSALAELIRRNNT
jgi:transcriptional regulator with XRE-family HTH domain